jgi:hypothetical protein
MHAPNVPEVECQVSNVIALFGLNVGVAILQDARPPPATIGVEQIPSFDSRDSDLPTYQILMHAPTITDQGNYIIWREFFTLTYDLERSDGRLQRSLEFSSVGGCRASPCHRRDWI